jgi:disulfide oxidoreductase YuzD
VAEGNTGTVNAVFTVLLSAASTQTVTVDYVTTDGTATSSADYVNHALTTLSFSPGETTKPVTVVVNGDVTDEPDEMFTVDLSNPVNATINDNQGLGTITDDDATPTITINDVTVAEGNTGTVNAVFTVLLAPASSQTVSVDYATNDATATAPADYTTIPLSTLRFSPGVTSQSITVEVNGDVLAEADETFTVDLSNPVNATVTDNQGIGTITNDDVQGPVTVSFQDGVNGYNGTRDTHLLSGSPNNNYGSEINLSADGSPDESMLLYWDLTDIPIGGSIQTVDFTYQVTNSTTQDYEIYRLHRAWNEGEATWNEYATGQSWQISGAEGTSDRGTISLGSIDGSSNGNYTISMNTEGISVVQSWVDDPSSNYGFIIMDYINATNGLEISSRETGTISNRPELTVTYSSSAEPNIPNIVIDDVTVAEGNTGTVYAVFTVLLSAASTQTVTVDYATSDGTATDPADYTAIPLSTLTFSPGVTSQSITVVVNGDVLAEADETFTVDLSNPVNATITDDQGTGTIIDNDPAPVITIDDVTVTEGNAGTVNAVFTLTLSATSSQTVTVDYATTDGSATTPSDYTAIPLGSLSFAPGVIAQNITVIVNGDVVEEADETFTIDLSNPVNATIAHNQGLGTITDDDAAPTISIDDVTVTEGNAGTVNAVFTVLLSTASTQTVTVDYATSDGMATDPTDYTAIPLSTLMFSPGVTSQSITVVVNGDVLAEADETFTVNLSNPVNATITDNQGTGTITNDDVQGPVTVSFQDGVNGYNETRDTYLLSGSPNNNYGSEINLSADGSPDESALLYWDLTSIPVGSSVQSVDFSFEVINRATQDYEIYRLYRAWNENEATWNEYASGQSWQISGADGAADRSTISIGSILGPSVGNYTISLNAEGISVVQSWVDDPSSNHGFIILDYISATNGLEISSRETGTISNRPQLTVTYSTSGSSSARINQSNEAFNDTETTTQLSPEKISIVSYYPNPFSTSTTIEYVLPIDLQVNMTVYNLRGQRVCNLVDEVIPAGYNTIIWNARDDVGRAVPDGIYLIQLLTEETRIIKKIIIQK